MFLSFLFAAQAAVTVEGELIREVVIEAGQQAEDVVRLQNPGPTAVRLLLYTQESEEADQSNRGWVRFNPRLVDVPAYGSAQVPYRVEVPKDVPSGGVYESALVVATAPSPELWPPAYAAKVSHPDARYTVRLVTMVGSDEEP
jgi:hypothetical protein